MSENELFLHIGFPKSGTTAIQDNLYINREYLLEQGLLYPQTGIRVNAHHLLPWTMTSDEKASGHSEQELFDSLAEEISGSRCTRAVVSSEGFIFACSPRETKERFSKLFDKITIVVYMREPLEWIESDYNQGVKGFRGITKTFDEYLSDQTKHDTNALSLFAFVDSWARIFGWNSFIIREYCKDLDIVDDFLKLLDLEKEKMSWVQPPRKNSNPRLSNSVVEYCRLLNLAGVEYSKRRSIIDFLQASSIDEYSDLKLFLSSENLEYVEASKQKNRREFMKSMDLHKFQQIENVFNPGEEKDERSFEQANFGDAAYFAQHFAKLLAGLSGLKL